MAFFSRKKKSKKKGKEAEVIYDDGRLESTRENPNSRREQKRALKSRQDQAESPELKFDSPPVDLNAPTKGSLSEKLAQVAPPRERSRPRNPDEAVAEQFAELRRVVRETEARAQPRAPSRKNDDAYQPMELTDEHARDDRSASMSEGKMSRRERKRQDKRIAAEDHSRKEKSGGLFRRKKKIAEEGEDEPLVLDDKQKIDEDILRVASVVAARNLEEERGASEPMESREVPKQVRSAKHAEPAPVERRSVSSLESETSTPPARLHVDFQVDRTDFSETEVDDIDLVPLTDPLENQSPPIELSEPASALEQEPAPTSIPVEYMHLKLPSHWLGLWVSEDGRSFYIEDAGRGTYLVTALPDPMSHCHFGPDFPELETWRMPSAFVREPVGDILADRLTIETVPGLPPEFQSPLVFLYFLVDIEGDEAGGNRFAEADDEVENIYIASDYDPGTANPWGDGYIPWLGNNVTYYKAPEKLDEYLFRRMENQEPRNNPD